MNDLPVSVALIDDDNFYRVMLFRQFTQAGIDVVFQADNGKTGIEKMKASHSLPTLVILDIEMPVMGGFETAQVLKNTWPNLIIVAHSSLVDQDSINRIIKSGADFYFSKEVGVKSFIKAVAQIIQN